MANNFIEEITIKQVREFVLRRIIENDSYGVLMRRK
jgi:hypothetical protein